MATFASTASAWWWIALLVGAPIVFIALFRAARFPLPTLTGRAIVAGTVAGLLIGPTTLGRFLPHAFETMAIGGAKERQALEYARWFNAHVPQAFTRMSDEARKAELDAGDRAIIAKQEALDAARWDHQQPVRALAMLIAAGVMLAAARGTVPRGTRDVRQGWIAPLSIGVWSFALPAAIVWAIARRWWQIEASEAALLAAAVGIGPWALGAIDRQAAAGAETGGARMMQTAGRVASIAAIGVAMWAAWSVRSLNGLLLVAPLLALPVAWLAESMFARSNESAASEPSRSFAAEAFIAVLATLTTVRMDLHEQATIAALGTVIVIGLLACDGRWLGAFIGAMLPGGRPALRTMRLVIPAMACGPTMLAVAALAMTGGLVTERFALPLLAGALVIEITAPARRRMAAQLIQAEAAIDEDRIVK